uniref:Proton-coupled zinc antiporter SLC30A5 n=1 Tax=Romanomermis culicivorax TaxID=13658 RepID=A0A915JS64_ROMCU
MQWNSAFRYSILFSLGEILWFYGITLCGPVRSVLIYENSSLVIVSALSAIFYSSSSSPSKVRGAVLMGLGFVSLVILDRDMTIPHIHSEKHSHHTGLNHLFYHVVNWFGIADHKGGIAILALALLIKVLSENSARKLSNDLGGPKRLYALSCFISAIVLAPWAFFTLIKSEITVDSWFAFLISSIVVTFTVFVADFYAESSCLSRLDQLCAARFYPILMFLSAFLMSCLWFESYRTTSTMDLLHGHGPSTIEHGFSGGLVFTLSILTFLAVIALSTGDRVKARAGQFVGYSASGLPLYVYGEDFLQKTSQSIMTFAKHTLRQVLANPDSRRIFYFLCVNLMFTFIEFIYGLFTNSLGLISDAFHMFFDCSALVIGLVAAVMSTWPRTRQYSYGYGRIEILSGFVNGLFLIVIACFIFSEAFKRMLEPPEVHTEKLLFVSVAGLLVNLFGIAVFHNAHGHDHGGGSSHNHSHDAGHGHSHNGNGHGHSHSHLPTAASHGHSHHGHSHNANMQGVFLHVLADTFGSVGVIISTILIQYFGWHIADPICSLLLSILIFLSVLPLLKQSTSALLLRPSAELEHEFKSALDQVNYVRSFESDQSTGH